MKRFFLLLTITVLFSSCSTTKQNKNRIETHSGNELNNLKKLHGMKKKSTPGVYVDEISKFPPSIATVKTAVPAFIGYTETHTTTTPTKISSIIEYKEIFGGPKDEVFNIAINDSVKNNNVITERRIIVSMPTISDFKMFYQLQMYFKNGGNECYIVSIGNYSDTVDQNDFIDGLNFLKSFDEPTLLVFPDAVSLNIVSEYGQVIKAALTQCNELKDRFTIIDVYGVDVNAFRNELGIDYLKYGAAYYPFLKTILNYGCDETAVHIIKHIQSGGGTITDLSGQNLHHLSENDPNLHQSILAEISEVYVELSPCGTIAGIYSRVDHERGVWKAPANVSLNSVIEPVVKITEKEQELLNIDVSSGKSINAIRSFQEKGTLVWGARTLAGNDNEWRYVPVRRFFNFAEESIKKGTECFVFEPNDANSWVKVKAMIENFLIIQWRNGALAGAKPEHAFYVKVGLGETMTSQDILEGKMIVEIGMAVIRPAEFIILRFSHKMQES